MAGRKRCFLIDWNDSGRDRKRQWFSSPLCTSQNEIMISVPAEMSLISST